MRISVEVKLSPDEDGGYAKTIAILQDLDLHASNGEDADGRRWILFGGYVTESGLANIAAEISN